ncbi:MAG: cyclic nucleotide-binding domain-containing protein [Deltaproteobacteria bacterium]|nr:cyclic nucleotide-binding domain-containing protein [Deltaproteobacteria bacterium]
MAKELPLGQGQWEWLGQTLSRHANAKMAPDVIKLVMPGVRLLEYEDNAAIVVENDIGYAMYVIYQGRVLVVRKGNKIAELETGDFFGEISLVTRAPRTATVKAVKNCQVFELSWRARGKTHGRACPERSSAYYLKRKGSFRNAQLRPWPLAARAGTAVWLPGEWRSGRCG